MSDTAQALTVGEIIEIKYRISRPSSGHGSADELADRWISAEIIRSDADTLPMARLADGQLTDIRAYMIWRRLPGRDTRSGASAGR